jgi:predicted dehydrogenase
MVRVGIAGYGIVGQKRRKFIDQNPLMNTVAVCDVRFRDDLSLIDGNTLNYKYKEMENISEEITDKTVNNVKYYRDYHHMLNHQNLDVLFVCLPNYLSAEVAILGLQNNCHVFCEKPPAKTVSQLKGVIGCSQQYPHLKLKYGFNHRYHDSVKKVKEIINSKKYGKVMSFRGVYGKSSIIPFDTGWRSEKKYAGGGILLDQGIHMLDLVRYFSCNYEEIHSFISNNYWNHDIEDDAFILMKSNEGQIASLHSTATQWQHRFRLEIILKEGLLELAGILSGSKSYGSETLKIIERKHGQSTGNQEEILYTFLEDNSWKEEIDEFANCIVNDRPVENGTSDDALKVMEMIFDIYKADKTWWKIFNNN